MAPPMEPTNGTPQWHHQRDHQRDPPMALSVALPMLSPMAPSLPTPCCLLPAPCCAPWHPWQSPKLNISSSSGQPLSLELSLPPLLVFPPDLRHYQHFSAPSPFTQLSLSCMRCSSQGGIPGAAQGQEEQQGVHRKPSQPGGGGGSCWGWPGRLGQCRAGDARHTHMEQDGRVQHTGFGHGGRRRGSPQGQREAAGAPWGALVLMPRSDTVVWLYDVGMPFCHDALKCHFAAGWQRGEGDAPEQMQAAAHREHWECWELGRLLLQGVSV